MRSRRIGILELTSLPRSSKWGLFWNTVFAPRYASVMSQVVAVWLRQEGYKVFYSVYHGTGIPHRLVPDGLDFLFIVTTSRTATLAGAAAEAYRAINNKVQIIACGPHTKGFDEPCPWADVTLVGGNKESILGLLEPQPKNVVVHSPALEPQELPSLEDRAVFIRSTHSRLSLRRLRVVPLLTSVGCPNSCSFCTNHDTNYRRLPNERVVEDLKSASRLFPRDIVAFHDPNIGVSLPSITLNIMSAQTTNLYIIESEFRHITDPVLTRLKEANIRYLAFAVDSFKGKDFDFKTRTEGLSPHEKVLQISEASRNFSEYVPFLQELMMFGFDGDDAESVFLIKAFIEGTPHAWCNISPVYPFRGTPLYEQIKGEGRLLSLPGEFCCAPFLTHVLPSMNILQFYTYLLEIYQQQLETFWERDHRKRRTYTQWLAQAVRIPFVKEAIQTLTAILRDSYHNNEILWFHEGRTKQLPSLYQMYRRRWLGPYRNWKEQSTNHDDRQIAEVGTDPPRGR